MKFLRSTTLLLVAATAAQAEYPDKPITMVVPFAAGGPTDKVARDLGDVRRKQHNQTIIIEKVGGAGGSARRCQGGQGFA